jgi:hypothetical protein
MENMSSSINKKKILKFSCSGFLCEIYNSAGTKKLNISGMELRHHEDVFLERQSRKK